MVVVAAPVDALGVGVSARVTASVRGDVVADAAADAEAGAGAEADRLQGVVADQVAEAYRLQGVVGDTAAAQIAEAGRQRDAAMLYVPEQNRILSGRSSLQLLTPIGGAEMSGDVLLRGTAMAHRGYRLLSVGVFVDGQYLGRAEGTTDWSFVLDTKRLLDGPHQLSLYAYVALAAAPAVLGIGEGPTVRFSSLNNVPTLLLHNFEASVSGVAADAWASTLPHDLVGFRVTFAAARAQNATLPLIGELVVAYKETVDEESGPRDVPARTWTRTYGLIGGGAMIVRPPYGVLPAPGVLSATAVFAGEGEARVVLEAILPH